MAPLIERIKLGCYCAATECFQKVLFSQFNEFSETQHKCLNIAEKESDIRGELHRSERYEIVYGINRIFFLSFIFR